MANFAYTQALFSKRRQQMHDWEISSGFAHKSLYRLWGGDSTGLDGQLDGRL